MMNSVAEILQALLSEERSTPERLESLARLDDFLRDEAVVRHLAEASRVERSVEVRRAMLQTLVSIDITRLKDPAPLLDAQMYFATMEPESELRLVAVGRLGELVPSNPQVQEALAETLACDLDENIQRACLVGLRGCTRKSPETIERLISFGRLSSARLRGLLLELYAQLDRADALAGSLAFLNPWEEPQIRREVLNFLQQMPALSPEASRALVEYLPQEPLAELQEQAVRVLAAAKSPAPELFRAVFGLLERLPDRAEQVEAFRHRLVSFPDLGKQLEELFRKTGSSRLKLRILDLLGAEAPVAQALGDASPWVRHAAIQLAARRPHDFAPELAEAIRREPIVSLRESMVRACLGVKNPAVEAFLVEWIGRETEPRIQEALSGVLLGVPITDENRSAILRAYIRVLREPFFDSALKGAVTDHLRSFAYRNEPELVDCLKTQLERAADIETVEALHQRLRQLEPDPRKLWSLLLKLLYRFIDHYPREPLDRWVNELSDVPEVRGEIPYLAKLTGASWILEKAEPSGVAQTILDEVRQGNGMASERLLREAWEKRALRKSDMTVLFRRLIHTPGQDGLMQSVMKIMSEGKLLIPEVIDACFAYLLSTPSGPLGHTLKEFLLQSGPADPSYRDRVMRAFTQENYQNFCGLGSEPMDRAVPKDWSDWEYQEWRVSYEGWPIADLFFELKPEADIARLLVAPPASSGSTSIQYRLLNYLWRSTEETLPETLRAIGTLVRNSKGHLRDRAIVVFWKKWKPSGGELAEMAAEVYSEILARSRAFGEEDRPKPLEGMDAKRLEQLWPLGGDAWKEFRAQFLIRATPEEEARARELFDRALALDREFRFEELFAVMSDLLDRYPSTELVRQYRKNIEAQRRETDPSLPVEPRHEKSAAGTLDLIKRLIQKDELREARATLRDLAAKCWRTRFVREHRAEVDALMVQLGLRQPPAGEIIRG